MKYIRLFRLVGLLIGLAVISASCASPAMPIETEADFNGFITDINQTNGNGTIGQISVESHADKIVTKYIITVKDDTLIFQQDGFQQDGEIRRVTFNELENNKQWVKIWFTGPVMESWPMQATARQVIVDISETKTDGNIEPVLPEPSPGVLIEVSCDEFTVSCDEFTEDAHITREIEITYPGSLIVSLCSNPTTGFQWEEVKIGDEAVIYQYEHNFVSPEATGVVGAARKDVWTFKSLKAGITTISFDYSRPWEGGEKSEWTLKLTVVVK